MYNCINSLKNLVVNVTITGFFSYKKYGKDKNK